ncbi:CopG family ribbon-helix-helix protein [Methanoplanus limicola]|jgi:metal-responsive CopG/Arc/MetJ family transcriptional regulator|uniref:CopG family ribbon-helix-helix protein n=1 Tax=Methanoplanus limicola TaxID=2315 RepID=UPI000A061E40|nr:ribbon-helix-helix domain-containing protein [Methanoplanus limicola]
MSHATEDQEVIIKPMTRISVRLPDEILEKLNRLAEMRKTNRSEEIRKAIQQA